MTFTDVTLDMSDNKNYIVSDRFDFILQEISILFDTAPCEVLGEHTFGTEFEKFIWDLNISNSEISEYVRNAIMNKTISGSYFDITVDTNILRGTESDIILVSIEIRDPETEDSTNMTYRID